MEIKSKEELMKLTKANLLELAKEQGIEVDANKTKAELVDIITSEIHEEAQVEETAEETVAEETEEPVAEPVEETAASKMTAFQLELAKRQSRFSTGIPQEGKSSGNAFKTELARRAAKYGTVSSEPLTESDMNRAFKKELERREALK